jgi:hypothetical protein
MAEGDIHIYRSFKENVLKGVFNLTGAAIRAALVSGYTRNEITHAVWANVSANEITDASYTRGTLATTAVDGTGTGNGTLNRGRWSAAALTFASLTGTNPNYLILYDDTPTDPADPLIACMELATTTNGGDYVISWNANGIIRLA